MNNEQLQHWLRAYSPSTAATSMPLVMGILNVTPDSFSDGGRYASCQQAVQRARELAAQGADILDIGGESSRPGASSVPVAEELARVLPVVKALRSEMDLCLSIDTCKVEVMSETIAAGAGMINDITALADAQARHVLAQSALPVCLMHRQMQQQPACDNVIDTVNTFFRQRVALCLEAGIRADNLILDPGFGFGKTPGHNMTLIKHLHRFGEHRLPMMLGVSRKSTLGLIVNQATEHRLAAGLAAAVFAVMQGASIIRTHDVAETKQAMQIVQAIRMADIELEGGNTDGGA